MNETRSTGLGLAVVALIVAVAGGCSGDRPSESVAGRQEADVQAGTEATVKGGEQARQRIVLEPRRREMVLAEMRAMLESIDGILAGLASDDRKAVAEEARAAGTRIAVDVAPEVRDRLPEPFMELGMRTHRAFDELAERVDSGADRGEILEHLGRITGYCVGCHASYRIDVSPPGSDEHR